MNGNGFLSSSSDTIFRIDGIENITPENTDQSGLARPIDDYTRKRNRKQILELPYTVRQCATRSNSFRLHCLLANISLSSGL
jgi:hypothetical protein